MVVIEVLPSELLCCLDWFQNQFIQYGDGKPNPIVSQYLTKHGNMELLTEEAIDDLPQILGR